MADSLNEALNELEEQQSSNVITSSNVTLVINNDLRTITVPRGLILGVYNDKDVLSINFEMPRSYDDIDLSEFSIQINYLTPDGNGNIYKIENPVVGDDKITFEWLLGRSVFTAPGVVQFNVCLKLSDGEGGILKEFNTTVAIGNVLSGIEPEENIDQNVAYSILDHIEAIEGRVVRLVSSYPSVFSTPPTSTNGTYKFCASVRNGVVSYYWQQE